MVEVMETPPRRRRSGKGVNSPMLNQSMVLLAENDDVKEKKARRKSQLLSNNLLSPGGVNASPGRQSTADRERRKSINLSHAGMSNEQLKAHYASCIKLSSENKINVKNAFALHLIDYMKDLLKESQNADSGTNFQLASCTLDAGVKIYSYRVDSVHKDTYKVLGSLGRAVDNQEDDEEGDGSHGSQEGSQKVKKAKKSSGKTIEKNLKNINCEQFDVDFEVDPYFHKTSAAYDEGGTAGLLSLQLKINADANQLVLDSSSKVTFEATPSSFEGEMSNLQFHTSSYSKCELELLEMCPALSAFLFRGWDKDSDRLGFMDDSFDDNVHRFDVNAPVIQDLADDFDTDSVGGGGYDDYSDSENPNEQDIGPVEFDGREAQFATPHSVHASIMNCTGASGLPLIFPLEVSEYSYFKRDVLSMWKGPLHWKVVARSKALGVAGETKKKGTKKFPFLIDLNNDDLDLRKMISSGRAETYLKESSLKKCTAKMTTLPLELAYEMKNLFSLFINSKLALKPQSDAPASTMDKGEINYDYDNKNDRDSFCAVVDDGGNYGDYDDDVGGGPEASFDMGTDEPLMIEKQGFGGESLIAPPAKIQILDINYAKSAKRIDIKKLKTAMWSILTEKEKDKENVDENARPLPDIEGLEAHDKSSVSGIYTFKSMYKTLPSKISSNMAKNLSGPISFVCLLYLANEKNLELTSNEKLNDITIRSNVTTLSSSSSLANEENN